MRIHKLILPVLFFVALFFVSVQAPRAEGQETITGRVVGVMDGDTIKILTPQKQEVTVRFAEMDAPEKDQPYGQKSKQALSDMVFNKDVRVIKTDTDRYGRTIGRVYVDNTDVNFTMVKSGAAWAYRQYLTDQTIAVAEDAAKNAKAGLWSLQPDQITPPWEWRHAKRDARASAPEASKAVVVQNPSVQMQAPTAAAPEPQQAQSCGTKSTCKQMSSCTEARFYLTQCGLSKLDRDGDGTPCDALCK